MRNSKATNERNQMNNCLLEKYSRVMKPSMSLVISLCRIIWHLRESQFIDELPIPERQSIQGNPTSVIDQPNPLYTLNLEKNSRELGTGPKLSAAWISHGSSLPIYPKSDSWIQLVLRFPRTVNAR
jgi:hypothetical protein